MQTDNIENLSKFFYEVGNLRKVIRAHQQTLMANDPSDNIASHSFRVTMIGYFLAKELEADADKVLKMCLMHDMEEIRSGDMNWVNKRYVKVYEHEIVSDQLDSLPHADEFKVIIKEYETRESKESKIAKDADLLDQIYLLKEYERQGNKEAESWLHLDNTDDNQQIKRMNFELSKQIAKKAISQAPNCWFKDIWTAQRR
jgi:putative hydrolases of HD superfamily